jgi:hypothetical protein
VTFETASGERVLWEGRPRGIRGFIRPMDVFFFVFTLLIGLSFATAVAATPNSSRGLFFVLPIALFGLLFVAPRLISIVRESGGASYVVTDRRIVIRNRGRLVELDLANLPYLELERSWLSGPMIYFGQRQMYDGWGGFYGGSPAPALRGLVDADAVYRIISDARRGARQR